MREKREKVISPDVYYQDHHPGTPPPKGPENLVAELEVLPFDQIWDVAWRSPNACVVSIWTENPLRSPFRFVLSEDAAKKLAVRLHDFLE